MRGAGVFFLLLFIVLLVYGGWVGWKIFNARKTGDKLVGWQAYVPFMKPTAPSTNYPTPRSSGPLDWIKDKIDGLRNKRSQTGGYEGTRGDVEGQYQGLNNSGGADSRRGRGLEDDAWDSRVENGRDEDPYGPGPGGYHEEQELGLAPTPGAGQTNTPYGGDYINQPTSYGGSRGRSTERESHGYLDPFADSNAAPSFRSVSPRPDIGGLDTSRGHRKNESEDFISSPNSTRKSVFREDVN